jgi:tRNA pseudouridine55 synthase
MTPTADGLVVVDKPAGLTSHDVVARVRRLAGTRKVGHAGTLDPMATGVLVVGINRATRLLGHLTLTEKAYDATVRLGSTTVTDDAEGEVVATADASGVSAEAVAAVVAGLTGDIQQVPSAVSAIKVDGQRSYKRVRDGEDVRLAARPVTVRRFDVGELRPAGDGALEVDVHVVCSSGTYVRALARDLGATLGVGGHLRMLRRTSVGPYGLDVAHTLEQLARPRRGLRTGRRLPRPGRGPRRGHQSARGVRLEVRHSQVQHRELGDHLESRALVDRQRAVVADLCLQADAGCAGGLGVGDHDIDEGSCDTLPTVVGCHIQVTQLPEQRQHHRRRGDRDVRHSWGRTVGATAGEVAGVPAGVELLAQPPVAPLRLAVLAVVHAIVREECDVVVPAGITRADGPDVERVVCHPGMLPGRRVAPARVLGCVGGPPLGRPRPRRAAGCRRPDRACA